MPTVLRATFLKDTGIISEEQEHPSTSGSADQRGGRAKEEKEEEGGGTGYNFRRANNTTIRTLAG